MKQITKSITVVFLGFLFLSAITPNKIFAEDNTPLASIYKNVILANAKEAVASCKLLRKRIEVLEPMAANSQARRDFTRLVKNWKKVEALYIAPGLNENAMDIPFLLDVFHIGRENMRVQMQRAIDSDAEPETALFKNSYKTINALEAVLFLDKNISKRKLKLATVQMESICGYLTDIKNIYEQEEQKFLAMDKNEATALLLNALSQSSFILKDWRIGDPAGLTIKYKGKPEKDRAEYFMSGTSMAAVIAILQAYEQVIGVQAYPNFIQLMASYNNDAQKNLKLSQKYLAQAQNIANQDASVNFYFSSVQTKPLFDAVGKLYNSYYYTLMQSLPVVVKILEADGD